MYARIGKQEGWGTGLIGTLCLTGFDMMTLDYKHKYKYKCESISRLEAIHLLLFS